MIEYRGYGDVTVRTSLRRDPDCPCEHRRWARVERDGAVVRSRPENGPEGHVFGRLLRHIFIQTSTVLVPRPVAEHLGGYDETLAYADEYQQPYCGPTHCHSDAHPS